MISTDPISSHDLKVSDLDLKFSDHTTNHPLPNFSIRDYVFGIRSKNISCNWPFSPTSLQLCLKHGVKNLLPPFESIDSLRNNSSLTRCSLEDRLTHEEVVNRFDGQPENDQFISKEKMTLQSETKRSSASKADQEFQFHLLPQTKLKEKNKPQKPKNVSSIRTIIQKNRYVMKVNSRLEQAAPTSETMTSKVCPVCKIFLSSSNTTLNAHIDQCLTGEGTLTWTENPKVNVVVKHRVKPRKMRLMVDIYKTAPHCTIEELDRRNGSSWATYSNFPAEEIQFQDEEVEAKEQEEQEPKRTTINTEVANNEGDVYIDTDGTKVRILSVPKVGSSDNHGGRKSLKEPKRSKIIVGKKKKYIFKKKHHDKCSKLSQNAEGFCSQKNQARIGQEDDVAMKKDDLGIIRPSWACSKRTGLLKNSIGNKRKLDIQSHEAKGLVVESEKSYSRYDLGRPQISSDNNGDSSQSRKKMKFTLSLIKQPLNEKVEFRKEFSPPDDDDDDDDKKDDDGFLDACPSTHSDDADTRSKGSTFSSLSKNLSFSAAKFNLKRRYSVVEKSGVHFNEKSINEQSQDSLKENSRIEEHVAIRSQTSNGECSVGTETVKLNELHDVDSGSGRHETLVSTIVPAPSFTGLSTSFDPGFSRQDCDDLYNDQICLTNCAPNDVDVHESYRQEVDPIPIPGPPGSFLPASPGGEMVSEEEIQPVTVLSTENQTQHHLDHTIDRDSMSNSPVSTISNSRSTSAQDDQCKKPFFSADPSFTTERGSSLSNVKNDHQPCCCSRKEVTYSYQDSYIWRKQQFNLKSEIFSSSNYPTSPAPETASFPTHKKFPVSSDCNSPAGSPSKPVLRLMGKNLTVVKTDEDEFRPSQSSQQHPQQPVPFSQYQNGFQSQHFNVNRPINMRSTVDLMPIHGGCMGSVDRYGHGGPYLGPSMTRSYQGHNVHDFHSVSVKNVYTAASSSKPINEIIIIDDSPESEPNDSMQNEWFKRNQRQMNPSYDSSVCDGSLVFRGDGFQKSLDNEDFGKWNIRSPSMSNLRSSTIYYPPNNVYR